LSICASSSEKRLVASSEDWRRAADCSFIDTSSCANLVSNSDCNDACLVVAVDRRDFVKQKSRL
jgi:hypothetical protein